LQRCAIAILRGAMRRFFNQTKSAIDMKKGMPQKRSNWRDGSRLVRVWEVIPVNKSKAYRSISVKQVDVEKILADHPHQPAEAGLDIGKESIWTVIRFRDGSYLRPWRAANPLEVGPLVGLLKQTKQQEKL